uniref:Uncharacterized protein n=1 Tax=Arundo donax TaxID=35708 RepID=A0A0A9DV53_ARUDO
MVKTSSCPPASTKVDTDGFLLHDATVLMTEVTIAQNQAMYFILPALY